MNRHTVVARSAEGQVVTVGPVTTETTLAQIRAEVKANGWTIVDGDALHYSWADFRAATQRAARGMTDVDPGGVL